MAALIHAIQEAEAREEEFLNSILDAAVLGATMALKRHHTPEETLASLRMTGTLTLNGKTCKGKD